MPLLNCIGYKISWTSLLILSYGGLRGAIALALAMLIAIDQRISQHLRDICLFYVVSTIVFTVCINGLTIKTIMRCSGFLFDDPVKEKMKNSVLRRMVVNTIKEKIALKSDEDLQSVNWSKIDNLVDLKKYQVLEELAIQKSQSKPVEAQKINFGNWERKSKTLDANTPESPVSRSRGSPRRSAYRNTLVGEKLQKLRDFVIKQANHE